MNKKTVIIVSPEFPLFTNWGGIATFSENLANLLFKLGYKVEVVTFDGIGDKSFNIEKNYGHVNCIPLNFENKILDALYFLFPFGVIRKVFKSIFPNLLFVLEWNLFFCLYMMKHYKIKENVLIHVPSYQSPTLLYGLLNKNTKQIIHIQGMQLQLNKYELVKSLELKILTFFEIFYVKVISDKIVACSNNIYRFLVQSGKYKNKEITYISNFINIKEFINKVPVNTDNIVYFGRLERRKGVKLLVKSFVKLSQKNEKLKLYLIGEDDSNLHDLVTELATKSPSAIDKIFFIPRIDNRNAFVEILLKIKGIAVFPAYYEPFGYTTVEAMAMGFITIASKNGGGSEILQDSKNGFLVKPNILDISRAINKAIKLKPSEIKKLTNEASIRVEEMYSLRSKIKEYKKLYSSFLD